MCKKGNQIQPKATTSQRIQCAYKSLLQCEIVNVIHTVDATGTDPFKKIIN